MEESDNSTTTGGYTSGCTADPDNQGGGSTTEIAHDGGHLLMGEAYVRLK